MKYLLLLILFFGMARSPWAQAPLDTLEKQLEETAAKLMMSDELSERQEAFNDVQIQLVSLLKREGSFHHPFSQLKRISLLEAPDSSFRVFSGQLYVDEDQYKYYGVIHLAEDPNNPIILTDGSDGVPNLEQDILTKDDWYGAVYYNIKSFSREGKKYYTLFGFDTYQMFENRKVAEILHFEDGDPIFGSEVFFDEHGLTKHRLVVQYASDVSIKLNYDEDLQLLIFDHLIPMKSPYKKNQIAMVPDGSYRGYQLNQSGSWMYIDKIFHTTLAEPPREKPVLDAEQGRDLFGKKKNR